MNEGFNFNEAVKELLAGKKISGKIAKHIEDIYRISLSSATISSIR